MELVAESCFHEKCPQRGMIRGQWAGTALCCDPSSVWFSRASAPRTHCDLMSATCF